ncbi:uncharacterized protein LOC129565739 [Sitodiplosis mosellana]|uniref:uncharacterized protein LOC129565739 n=1 Tax=Sitodiplosis mosellana TaxID=263140 RepID=UPI002443D17D|nr:uncharacterized protein LOC129565739 [Sitodiplosis mosellana]
MPYNERLGLKQNYENDFKLKSNAQNQSSSQCGLQTNWQLANTPKRQPLEPVNGEYPTVTSQAAAVLESPTKLNDLNYDCLEHIFGGFCLVDLIGIGGTCTYLQSATCRYFQTKFRKHTVFIDCERFPNYSISSGAVHQRTNIGSDIEAFMFVFGAVLSKLAIVNMCPMLQVDPERLESDAKIQRLIEKYCRNHLREISFRNCGKLTMNHAQPLEEVVKVSFDHCVLGEKLANFDYMFPKLKRLDLIDCDVRGVRRSIEK